jgi:hypothetical protein
MPANSNASGRTQTPGGEASMFAPTPIWARDAKPRRRTRKTRPLGTNRPAMDAGAEVVAAEAVTAEMLYEPLRVRPGHKRRGMLAAVIGAIIALVALIAGAGWYVSQQNDEGVAVLTPGAPETAPPLR